MKDLHGFSLAGHYRLFHRLNVGNGRVYQE